MSGTLNRLAFLRTVGASAAALACATALAAEKKAAAKRPADPPTTKLALTGEAPPPQGAHVL